MRRLGLVGLCIAAAFVTAGVASASAAPPEFGRCVKVAVGTGVYATANCTSPGGEQKYEWLPGPPPNPHFTLEAKEFAYFEGTVSKARIGCNVGAKGEGEITSATTVGNLTLTFEWCAPPGLPSCSNTGKPDGKIIVSGLSGELGVIKAGETPVKDSIGLTLAGEASYECEGLVRVHFHGSAVGKLPGHTMGTTHSWRFRISANDKQVPEKFEGGIPQTFEQTVNGTPEGMRLWMWEKLITPEKVEINPVV